MQALERIAEDIKGVPIDVVMYVDRLDLYRVEPLDKRVSLDLYEVNRRIRVRQQPCARRTTAAARCCCRVPVSPAG
jgi:hypothetical protein